MRYRRVIRKRLEQIDTSTFFGGNNAKDPFRLIRDKSKISDRHVSIVDLNPTFVDKYSSRCRMISLGTYLGQLRPSIAGDELPEWLESELQAALGLALLRALGPTMGKALLPGTAFLNSITGRIARVAVSMWKSNENNERELDDNDSSLVDHSGLPLTLYNIVFMTELNYQRSRAGNKSSTTPELPTPWEVLCRGEVVQPVLFGGTLPKEEKQGREPQEDLVPNPFYFPRHWFKTIQSMEEKLIQKAKESNGETLYEPHSKALPPPKPIDDRLLPDLYLGYGGVQSTHTQRESLYNRLLSVVLNRLTSNYLSDRKEKDFVVVLENGKEIRKTEDLIKAIINMGHQVEVVVTSHVTTFGLGLCLKEDDEAFTQIPLAAMVENGYADKRDRKVYTALTHGGMNLEVRNGPLLQNISIQHFIAIDGLCAWSSNSNADAPWIQDIECGPRLKGLEVIPAVRLAAMQALIVSTIGTELSLPNGGYGLTGVCNDTAAWLEQSLFGSTHVYPVTLTGRFAIHMIRRATELEQVLQKKSDFSEEAKAIRRLIFGLSTLPSDLTNLPSGVVDQCQRQLHCMHPDQPFKMMIQTEPILRETMKEIIDATSHC
jgi:hypothetical protein